MALPKLNETIKYSVKIPSTGETVRYRPYLVKEEKVLMLALEQGDEQISLEAIADTLEAFVKSPMAKRTEKEHKKAMKKAEVHNKKVQVKLDALRKDAIAQTGNKNIAPRDYPKDLNDKWESIYALRDHIESYPFSLKNVKEFIAFLRECGGFRVC